MGTAKRERKKANRQLKLEQLDREWRKRRMRRLALRFGIIVPLAVGAAIVLIILLGNDDDKVAGGDVNTTLAPVSSAPLPTEPATTVAPTTTIAPLSCPADDGTSVREVTFPAPPPMCIDLTKVYEAEVVTNKGTFTIDLDPGLAPETVNNFVYLARYHYFDGTVCHRIIPDFVVQCGDPTATGSGDPGYEFADELPQEGAYQLGSLAMANSGPNTNGSQFFIVTGDKGVSLPPLYSLFGQVSAGFDDTVKAMEAAGTPSGAPSEEVRIQSVTISVKEGAVPSTTVPITTIPTTTTPT